MRAPGAGQATGSTLAGVPATAPALDEPVLLSAPLAHRVAAEFCRHDPRAHGDCSWYHGLWQYLRVFGVVRTPQHHGAFYLQALQSVARGGRHPRVLVSGAADYSMLAHVLGAYRLAGAMADVTVVDRCETPLLLSRWYAGRLAVAVETRAADILDFDAADPFDVICTHSFLGEFSPDRRRRLMATWHRLLRPGGKVVTVNRIRPGVSADEVRFAPEHARAFQEAALREAARQRHVLPLDLAELARWVETYTARYWIYALKSRDDLRGLLTGGGFAIDHCDVETPAPDRTSGPSADGGAGYAQIIASRA